MIYLFDTTALAALRPNGNIRFDGTVDTKMYLASTLENLTHYMSRKANTCFAAPSVPFWTMYLQYLRTIYPDLDSKQTLHLVSLAERYLHNVRWMVQGDGNYYPWSLKPDYLVWLEGHVRTIASYEFTTVEILPLEILMADYFGNGEYKDLLIEKLRSFCRHSINMTLREMRAEFLYKLDSLPTRITDDPAFKFTKYYLSDDDHLIRDIDMRAVSGLMNTFYHLYREGYDAATADNVYLMSLFLNLLLDAEESGDYLKLLEDDVKRQFTVLFAHGKFAQKSNPYFIEYLYKLRRANSDDLKLFVLR